MLYNVCYDFIFLFISYYFDCIMVTITMFNSLISLDQIKAYNDELNRCFISLRSIYKITVIITSAIIYKNNVVTLIPKYFRCFILKQMLYPTKKYITTLFGKIRRFIRALMQFYKSLM